MNNDITDLSVNSIAFTGASGGYTLNGAGNLVITGSTAITSMASGTSVCAG